MLISNDNVVKESFVEFFSLYLLIQHNNIVYNIKIKIIMELYKTAGSNGAAGPTT